MMRHILALVLALAAGPAFADGSNATSGSAPVIGPLGPKGDRGCAVLQSTGAPDASLGLDCDFAFDPYLGQVWGPKTAGAWPSPPVTMSPVLRAQGFASVASSASSDAKSASLAALAAQTAAQGYAAQFTMAGAPQGSIAFRGAAGMSTLAPGIKCQTPASQGPGADVQWLTPSRVNLLCYIPSNYWTSILDRTITSDLSPYIQTAFDDSAMKDQILDAPSGLYPACNLTAPSPAAYDIGTPYPGRMLRLESIGATFVKLNCGNNNYLFASARWASPISDGSGHSYAGGPMSVRGVRFDGAGIARDVVVNVGYGVTFERNSVTGGTRHCYVEDDHDINGALITGSRYNLRINFNNFSGCGGRGFYHSYVFGSSLSTPTDSYFQHNHAWDNAAENVRVDWFSGWDIAHNHAWYQNVAPSGAGGCSVRLGGNSAGHSQDNIWEAAPISVTYSGSYPTEALCLSGGGIYEHETIMGPASGALGVRADFSVPGTATVRFSNSIFTGAATLTNVGAGEIVSDGNTFGSGGYSWSSAALSGVTGTGRITSNNDRKGSDGWNYTGKQAPGCSSVSVPQGTKTLVAADFPYTVTSADTSTFVVNDAMGTSPDRIINLPASMQHKYRVIRAGGASGAAKLIPRSSGGTDILWLTGAGLQAELTSDCCNNWRASYGSVQ